MHYCEFCGKREATYRCKKCGFLQCGNCLEKDHVLGILTSVVSLGISLLTEGLSFKSCVNCKKTTIKKI